MCVADFKTFWLGHHPLVQLARAKTEPVNRGQCFQGGVQPANSVKASLHTCMPCCTARRMYGTPCFLASGAALPNKRHGWYMPSPYIAQLCWG